MAQDCPTCGLANPESAQRCDCGYDFGSRMMKESYLTPKEQGALSTLTSGDIAIRVLLPVVGIIMGVIRLRPRRPTARRMLRLAGCMLIAQIGVRVLAWRFR